MAKVKTKTELENLVIFTTQLSEDEIDSKTTEYVIDRSLILINSYYPKITQIPSKDAVLLDVYEDKFSSKYLDVGLITSMNNLNSIYSINWTMDLIYSSSNAWLINIFEELFINNYILIASNKRRSATLPNIEIELRGDDFYSEASEKIEKIKEILINSTPQLL